MTQQQYLLAAAAALALLLVLKIVSVAAKKRRLKQMDFDRKLSTVLKPEEELLVIHKERSGRWILTKRSKQSFT